MNKKQLYRIELYSTDGLAKDISVLAALSNGGKYIPLTDMEMIVKSDVLRYPSLYNGISVTISENTLLIDKTVGDKTENLLCITEVEVYDLAMDCPTNQCYENTGIGDKKNHEQLN